MLYQNILYPVIPRSPCVHSRLNAVSFLVRPRSGHASAYERVLYQEVNLLWMSVHVASGTYVAYPTHSITVMGLIELSDRPGGPISCLRQR